MSLYKNKYLNPALFLMLCAVMFKFGPDGVAWFWAGQPIVALALLATSALFWGLMFSSHRHPKP